MSYLIDQLYGKFDTPASYWERNLAYPIANTAVASSYRLNVPWDLPPLNPKKYYSPRRIRRERDKQYSFLENQNVAASAMRPAITAGLLGLPGATLLGVYSDALYDKVLKGTLPEVARKYSDFIKSKNTVTRMLLPFGGSAHRADLFQNMLDSSKGMPYLKALSRSSIRNAGVIGIGAGLMGVATNLAIGKVDARSRRQSAQLVQDNGVGGYIPMADTILSPIRHM